LIWLKSLQLAEAACLSRSDGHRQVQVSGGEASQHEAKSEAEAGGQVKEVKFRPGTDENDYQIKLRNVIKFLSEGDKAKITLRFRGREMAHQEIGMRMLERIKARSRAAGDGRAVAENGRTSADHGAGSLQEKAALSKS
jgi:hypothetical protein